MKKAKFDLKKHEEELLESDIKKLERSIELGILPKNPTRIFEIGERVIFGAHSECYIRESYHDNLFYKVEGINVRIDRDTYSNKKYIQPWFELYKFNSDRMTTFKKEEKYKLNLSNTSIESLLWKVYSPSAGVDFDVEYQREYVWTIDDKIALIDSIFNNIDIGKFVFISRNYSYEGKLFEILDGKQRLSALCEFYEDRFKYEGYYFSELSLYDKNKILNHNITFGVLENPDKKTIFETFIKLNTAGKVMKKEDIDKVKHFLKNLK